MPRSLNRESLETAREDVLRALNGVLERDNALSRCCVVKALERLASRDGESAKRLVGLLLRDPDPDVRMDCAAALGRMRAREATVPLIDSLRSDPEGDVRIQATVALSKIKSETAVEPLIDCLRKNGYPDLDNLVDDMEYGASWEVQSQALNALGEIGDPRATGPVIDLLEDEEFEDLQESGFRVLARLDNERTRAFLLGRLKDGGRLARRRAARALSDTVEVDARGRDLAPDLLAGLTNALLDSDAAVRVYAARALGGGLNPVVVAPLTLLLSDADMEVRKQVAEILGNMRGRDVVDRLHPLLDEPDPSLKRRIVEVLGDIGDPVSCEPLSRLLDSPDDDLRYEVVRALGKLGLSGPEEKIAGILAGKDAHSTLRTQAARALGRILKNAARPGDRKGSPGKRAASDQEIDALREDSERLNPEAVLTRSVFDDDESVSLAALSSLVEIDSRKAVATLVGLLRGTVKAADNEAEQQRAEQQAPIQPDESLVGGDPETSTLASMLAGPAAGGAPTAADADGHVEEAPRKAFGHSAKNLAARLLGDIPDPGPKAIEALIDATEDADADLQREVLLSLGRIGDRNALPALVKGLASDQRDLRLAALEAMGGFGRASDVEEHVLGLLDDADPFIRQRAIETLGRISGVRGARRLAHALDDPDREVCRAALRALSRGQCNADIAERIVGLMFRFAGELRTEAVAALRRLDNFDAVSSLQTILTDMECEEVHWICIDALAEMLALEPTGQAYGETRHAGVDG